MSTPAVVPDQTQPPVPAQPTVPVQPPAQAQPTSPPPQAPPPPSPQQVQAHHESLLGKAVKSLMGQNYDYSIDPKTGQTVTTQTPMSGNQLFRHILAGAILGGAVGSKNKSGNGFESAAQGGEAVLQKGQNDDLLKREQAQQQYKNQLEAQENDRKNTAAQSEEQVRKAQIAQANAETLKTNIMTQGANYTIHDEVAKRGEQHFSDYKEAGLQPVMKDISESDMNQVMKNRPGASALDWEATGVKVGVDGQGNPTHEYTYTAYDPKGDVPISKGTLDQWKKDGMEKYHPELFDILKPGSSIPASQYIALKQIDTRMFNDQKTRETATTDLAEKQARTNQANASAAHSWAESKKTKWELGNEVDGQKQETKNAELFANATDELNKVGGDFSKLTPKSAFIMAEHGAKMIPMLNVAIKEAVDHPEANQDVAGLMKKRDDLLTLVTGATQRTKKLENGGAGEKVMVSTPDGRSGEIPSDQVDKFLQDHPGSKRASEANPQQGQAVTVDNTPSDMTVVQSPQGSMMVGGDGTMFVKNNPQFKIVGRGKKENKPFSILDAIDNGQRK